MRRIVIAGGSVSLFVVPDGPARGQGNYGERLPALLPGHDVDVRHTGQWFDLIGDLRRRYESAVRNHFPDVLVLNYGMGEAQPNVVPTLAARHFQSWDRSSAPVAQWYRQRVAPPVWRRLREVQRRTSHLPTYRLSPERYAIELRKVVTMARDETGCLVLLLDLDPPGERWTHWVPSMPDRRTLFQAVQDRLVADFGDPDVRAVRGAAHVVEHGSAVLTPDGIHRSALGHQLTAEALAREVQPWLDR